MADRKNTITMVAVSVTVGVGIFLLIRSGAFRGTLPNIFNRKVQEVIPESDFTDELIEHTRRPIRRIRVA